MSWPGHGYSPGHLVAAFGLHLVLNWVWSELSWVTWTWPELARAKSGAG